MNKRLKIRLKIEGVNQMTKSKLTKEQYEEKMKYIDELNANASKGECYYDIDCDGCGEEGIFYEWTDYETDWGNGERSVIGHCLCGHPNL